MSQILITIDTEIGELGKYRPDAFETFIEGKVGGKEVGYKFIMEMLDKYNAKGEFFVDIYPYKQIGEDKFANLCENIVKRGHHVQLHTHPSMYFSRERIHMHQYSLKEQIEILELGKEKINDWIGKYPIAHRAGGYGINEDTLKALSQVGIPYDSSYFYGNGNCKFQCDVKNKPFRIGKVVEIPITLFKRIFTYKFLNRNIIHREHFQKMDMRYGAAVDELKKVIDKSGENDIIVLFLHSFNFLILPYNFRKREYGRISINEGMIKDCDDLLKWISLHKKGSFTTIDTLRIDFSHDDICIEIPSMNRGGIKQKIFDDFTNRVLKVRRT